MLSHTSGMPDLDESEYDELVAHPEWDEGAADWQRAFHMSHPSGTYSFIFTGGSDG
jgi:hypothetical protein